jgi:methylmalonyl-CoA mutase N-terminal domain/subunit
MGYSHFLETPAEPLVNVARCAVSVTGAVLGGVDYLCAAAYDEALRTPSDDASALALRTMQVVGIEHGVALTVDALDGSTKMTELDALVEDGIREGLTRIEEAGGAVACIANGVALGMLSDHRGTRESQLATGRRTFVGENAYSVPELRSLFRGSSAPAPDAQPVEDALIERIVAHKATTRGAVEELLLAVELAASGDANLVPPTIDALLAGASVEQIVTATAAGFTKAEKR